MRTNDFDYHLPPRLIAQTPVEPRDSARLMVLHRADGSFQHLKFNQLDEILEPTDLLVCNDTQVFPARLRGRRVAGGGKVEVLLLRKQTDGVWEALVKPGRRLPVGSKIALDGPPVPYRPVLGEIGEKEEGGIRLIRFDPAEAIESIGEIPLPPYIHTPLQDPGRYQTIYAQERGSAAAPTAGLHFTEALMSKLQQKGIRIAFLTLHIGLDTFRPVREEDPTQHPIHREYLRIEEEAARLITEAKKAGGRVIAVGTSTVRALEWATRRSLQKTEPSNGIAPLEGWADLFIFPGHQFLLVDGIITNFHLPRSTLLMLVSAFAGRELILRAYHEAIAKEYRFYSFGDAMLIV